MIKFLHNRVIPVFVLMLCMIFMLINITHQEEAIVKADGDIIIGGLLPIHKAYNSSTSKCSKFNWKQILNAIAMTYAIENINQNRSILPNITLGYDIRDGCGSNNQVIRQLLDILFDVKDSEPCSADEDFKYNDTRSSNSNDTSLMDVPMIDQRVNEKLIGLIDSNSDKSSGDIQVIAKSLNIPQVSCTATATQFSNIKVFSTFYRTIPPDFQVVPIALAIANHFNWKFVSLITFSPDLANPMHQRAKDTFIASGICLDVNDILAKKSNFTKTAVNIKNSAANVVIILSDRSSLLKLLVQLEKQNVTGKTLVTSSSWDSNTFKFSPQLVGGMIGISLNQRPSRQFITYLKQASVCQKFKPFLVDMVQEYGKKMNNDTRVDFMQTCSLLLNHAIQSESTLRNISYKVDYVIDAVYALAHATHKTLNCNQSRCQSLPLNHPYIRKKFAQNLSRISFAGVTSKLFEFNRFGDPKFTKYHIVNSKPRSQNQPYIPVVVGSWQANNPIPLYIRDSDVGFGPYANISSTGIGQSCSLSCQPGSYYQLISSSGCCWKCIPCPPNTVSNQTQSSLCDVCPSGSTSNYNNTKCILTQPIRLRYDSIQNIIFLTYLTIAVAITFLVWIVLIKFRQTPVVKASDFTLSQMYIVGILMCMIAAVFLAGPINNSICAVSFITFCSSLCFIMSIVLVKTIRISRVFKADFAKSNKTKVCLSRHGLATLAIIFTLTEVVICVVANNLDPIIVQRRVISQSTVYLQCRSTTRIGYFVALGYFFIICIICTYMAFKTRKIPNNFGEAKYISFTTYITLVALITMIPAYFGTAGPFQAAISSFGMVTFALSILLCMFGQRLYVILWQPELNTKENIMLDVATYSFNTAGTPKVDRKNYFHTGSAHANTSINVSTASETSGASKPKTQSSLKH